MILGVGIDLIEVARFEREVGRRGEALLTTLFSVAELESCRSDSEPFRSFAAGFAVKEALFKALGTGWAGGVGWRDVEVSYLGRRPSVRLTGQAAGVAARLGVERVHVSVTVAAGTAAAAVVLEGAVNEG